MNDDPFVVLRLDKFELKLFGSAIWNAQLYFQENPSEDRKVNEMRMAAYAAVQKQVETLWSLRFMDINVSDDRHVLIPLKDVGQVEYALIHTGGLVDANVGDKGDEQKHPTGITYTEYSEIIASLARRLDAAFKLQILQMQYDNLVNTLSEKGILD